MRGSGLSDYIIAILELFEAEGRALKKETLKVGYSLGFILTGIGVLLISMGYLLWAFNGVLSDAYGKNLGSLITAGIGFVMSFILLLVAKWLSR